MGSITNSVKKLGNKNLQKLLKNKQFNINKGVKTFSTPEQFLIPAQVLASTSNLKLTTCSLKPLLTLTGLQTLSKRNFSQATRINIDDTYNRITNSEKKDLYQKLEDWKTYNIRPGGIIQDFNN